MIQFGRFYNASHDLCRAANQKLRLLHTVQFSKMTGDSDCNLHKIGESNIVINFYGVFDKRKIFMECDGILL